MNDTHIQFMRQAIALAKKGKESIDGGTFGAVIVKDNTVVAAVHNLVRGSQDCTQHAEIRAIQTACQHLNSKDLSDCTLYTSCEPCMMCLGGCYWAGFQKIFFGASAEDAKEHGYIYSDMFYGSDRQKRYTEFNMQQLLKEEAIAVWK